MLEVTKNKYDLFLTMWPRLSLQLYREQKQLKTTKAKYTTGYTQGRLWQEG